MIYPIYTELTECRDCYKCVRHCPVKAIQVKNGSAVVTKERCITCGTCVATCPNNAKKVRSDVNRVRQFMGSREKIIASLAPSYVAEFPGREKAILAALKKLGFNGVSETAVGAALVNGAVLEIAKKNGGKVPYIGTACPSVIQMVYKYYPEDIDKLLPVPSPLQCQCAYLRYLYGDDIGIVFIGPCVAKKLEADQHPGYPDFALTFNEFREWLAAEKIDLSRIPTDDTLPLLPVKAGRSAFYPVEGGMIASLPWGGDPFQTSGVALSGADAVLGALSRVHEGIPYMELLTCGGGCINGPGTAKETSLADRKLALQKTVQERVKEKGTFEAPADFVDRIVQKGYDILRPVGPLADEELFAVPSVKNAFSEEEIEAELEALGKKDKADRLNCGGCGYNSCRDMAIACLAGMAEPEMCVTNMRKLAQSKMDVLLRTIPMGVVMVGRDMTINDCNAPFCDMFCDLGFEADDQALKMMHGLPLEQFVPFSEKFKEQFDSDKKINQYRLHYKDKFLRVTFFSIAKEQMVGAIFEDVTNPTVRRETVVKKAEDVIEKSLSTVQQIASLLGENAADTEIMLNSLIDAFKVPSAENDDDAGFVKDDQQDLS